MKFIAHRGYTNKNIKENTHEAFENAILNGFEGIECDVRMTKDKFPVVCHNAFIGKTSDSYGLINSYTYDELKNFNFGSKETKSKIPLLKDVLTKYSQIKIIELKEYIDIKSIYNYIDDNTYFISFDTTMIKQLKREFPKLKFGILNMILNTYENYDLDIICILDSLMTKNIENYFTKKGIKIFIYGIYKQIKYKSDNPDIYYIVDKKY